jgi:exonuclease SbcC
MIPLKLQLKNFLSYGSAIQTIDFAPYPLICLSGKNGHGKSALLDALTWAVWGHARKVGGTTKADEGLLRLGQTHMLVSFDFSCNGQLYRVRREYSTNTGKAVAHLDFGIVDPQSGHFRALTDKTIRTTQDKIDTTIGLDYDSFINSVFLRQGQSNEFSKKSPKDRKEILASILGLNRYELIRKRAVEKVRRALVEKEYLEQGLERLQRELTQEQEIAANRSILQMQLQEYAIQEKEIIGQLQTVQKTKQETLAQQHELQRLTAHYTQLAQQYDECKLTLYDKIQQWRLLQKKQHDLGHQEKYQQQVRELEQKLKLVQESAQKRLDIKETYLRYKEQEQAYHAQLEQEHAQLRYQAEQIYRIADLAFSNIHEKYSSALLNFEGLKAELQENQKAIGVARGNLTRQASLLQEIQTQEKLFERRKNFYHKWIAQGNHLKTQSKDLFEKHLHVMQDASSCPWCEQPFSQDMHEKLSSKLQLQLEICNHRLERYGILLKKLKALLTEQHTYISSLKKESDVLYKQDALCQELLSHNEIYLEIVQQRKKYELMLNSLEYDQHHHEQILRSLHEAQQQLQNSTELLKQLTLQEQKKKEIGEQSQRRKNLKNELALLPSMVKQLSVVRDTLIELDGNEQDLALRLHNLAQAKERHAHAQGALEQQWKSLEAYKVEHKRHNEQIATLASLINDYQAIAQALSKDGIQALLIEESIPEIESEANIILSKLTENQAHLRIESLRDLKGGGTKETLDIKISDSLGIRPYELFSGGEAFRIDFALRIAISKLLARRAGTSLQTLIIDEGFGSQDEEGLNNIMEALYKVQEDFAKIIVVSHMPAMKDQFPVHFSIYKGANGSTVRVLEQG